MDGKRYLREHYGQSGRQGIKDRLFRMVMTDADRRDAGQGEGQAIVIFTFAADHRVDTGFDQIGHHFEQETIRERLQSGARD